MTSQRLKWFVNFHQLNECERKNDVCLPDVLVSFSLGGSSTVDATWLA